VDTTKSFDEEFPITDAGFASLPTVSFVIPGLDKDMHDYDAVGDEVENPGESATAVANGDQWLEDHIDPYLTWAHDHNSLLIVTFDEDSTADWVTPPLTAQNDDDYTGPQLGPNAGGESGPNQITMLMAGDHILPGNYDEGAGITNVNLLRTMESFYGLSPLGAQSTLATEAGIGDGAVTDVFAVPEPAVPALAIFGMLAMGAGWAKTSRR